MKPKTWRWFSLLVVLSMLLSATGVFAATSPPPVTTGLAAAEPNFTGVYNELPDAKEPALYIVRLHDPALASYFGGIPGLAATSPRATGAAKLDAKAPASVAYLNYLEGQQSKALVAVERTVGRSVKMTFQYLAVLNGFAVTLTPEEAAKAAKLPEVQAVYRDVEREMDTDVGPIHIGAPAIWTGDTGTGVATRGEGVVIGVIDSGINYLHPSFAATDGGGYTHTNPYGAGVYKGWCVANPSFCNAKLIAAYNFYTVGGNPVDTDGHGSHTASTAGGNAHTASFNVGPTAYNIPIQGVAPRANIVAYKVCDPGCPGTASVAAVNSAILNDGVDVLNYSISGSDSPWNDTVDLAFLDAYNAGIFVSASAGNAGPGASTVAKTGPWNASVAASTINRVIANTLDVTGPTTPTLLQGMAAVPGELTSIVADVTGPIRYNAANSNGCVAFSTGYFTGALALIQRGGCTFTVKVTNASAAGATGVVIFNNVGGPPISMGGLTGTPPAFMLDLDNGTALRDYVVANPTATARVNVATSLVVNNDWEDIVAGFSSRGPSQFELVKPDYIAPGVNTLAAVAAGATPAQYAFYQGTSMSSPHGAGAAALMVALYPGWSPAEIKSALASTATGGLVKEDGVTPADPFDVGSGLLNLAGASNAGLVFDETYANYVAANPASGGDPKTLNQPSMANYNCATSCTWTRTVKAVVAGTWNASYTAPVSMTVTVTPSNFTLTAGQTQVLTIQADVSGLPLNQWAFGDVVLIPALGRDTAATHLPVVVKPTANIPDINVTPTSLAATQAPDTTTSKILNIGNIGTAPLTWNITEAPVAMRIALGTEGGNTINAPISLVLDDGTADNNIGIGGTSQFIFLNRFTPAAGSYPITLNQIQIYFETSGMVNVGDDMLLAVYENTSGSTDPAVGSNLLATFPVAVTALDAWNAYNLATPVTLNGPGDVLIGVVALEIPGTSYWPAALDQTASQQRSWAGWWSTATAPTPPTLPPDTWTLIDAYFAGNWLVRGFGEGTAVGCDNPADVPWLTVAPTGGTTAGGGSTPVTVGFDSTGLAVGAYSAILCVASNDPATPLVEVPVSLTVAEPNVLRICSTPNVAIPDNNPTGVSDTINVPNDLTIADLDIYIRAPHTWVGDVQFRLQHVDSGTTAMLIDRPGVPATTFGCSGNDYDVTVDDEGLATPIENQCGATPPVITGDAPGGDPPSTSLLAAFDGESTLGAWTLTAIDNAGGDAGTLAEWCVDVTYEPPPPALICNASAEGFENGVPPAGWQVQTYEPDGPQWTTLAACGEMGNYTNGTGEAACVNSDAFGAAEFDTSLVTPVFDLTGYGSAALNYTVNYQNYAGLDFLDVDISADGGATWTTLLSWNEDHGAFEAKPGEDVSLDLAAYTGQSGLMLRWRYYDPNTEDFDWYAQVDNVELTCVEGEMPNINVTPTSLAATQLPDTTTSQTLDIGNTGAADLTWEIFEQAAARSAMVDWGDNFDSYTTGSQLHGQGGWKGWVNDPTAGALTSAAQATSAPNSAAILGASDLVHEYGETDGQWVYTAWQYVPTDFTGQSYFILLNTYSDSGPFNWSAQVLFNGTANTVVNDGGVSGGSLPLVKGQWVELRVEINLDADTGAFYYNNQLLYSGTWSGQVSGSGATSIAAVDLFANGASVIYYDDMSLVAGATVCDAPSDIPWLSETPTNGTTLPSASTPVQVTFDSTGLAPGTYNANLCVESNDPDPGPGNGTELVIVPVELTVQVPPPNIDVDPLSLTATQPTDTTTQQTLDIANTGGANLSWSIVEEPLVRVAPQPTAPNPNADPAQAREAINPLERLSREPAAPAPRSSWRWLAAVLYDNGPLVTHPGGGAGGADASALQSALSLSTYGFGHAVASGYRVADDFTVPAGGWTIDAITFFAYQTGSTTASTINVVNLRIWDGVPGAAGSNIVFGDTTTNRLASTTWSNIYRVLDTAMTGSTRPIMASAATVGAYLPAGSYWVDWQTGGSLSSGPWAPPISILGQTITGNALQYDPATTLWNPAIDTGASAQQGLPFVIEGTAGAPACWLPSDVPWLTTDPISGTTAPAGSTPVQVTFDSTGLAVGTYNANLCIASNDPDPGPGNETELVIVPVTLIVEEPVRPSIILTKTVGIVSGVCATTDDITVVEGTTVYYCYTVQNTGNVTLDLHDLVDNPLGPVFTGLGYALTPGSSINTVAAGLSIPAVINVTTVNTATWTAYNANGPSVQATDTARVVVEPTAVTLVALAAGSPALWGGLALLGAFVLGGFVWRRKRR